MFGKVNGLVPHRLLEGDYSVTNEHELPVRAKTKYREHVATIRQLLKIQPERLLEYKMGDGGRRFVTSSTELFWMTHSHT